MCTLRVMDWEQIQIEKGMTGKIRYFITYWLLRLPESAQNLQKISHTGVSFLAVTGALRQMPQISKESSHLPSLLV